MTSPVNFEAQKGILEEAKRVLRDSKDLFSSYGLDPQKTTEYLKSRTTPEMLTEARAAFEADMREIEQEVRNEMSRLNSNSRGLRPHNRNRHQMI